MKYILNILFGLMAFAMLGLYMQQAKESKRLETNLTQEARTAKDRLGREVQEKMAILASKSELESTLKKIKNGDTARFNEYEKRIASMVKELYNNGRKIKDLESAVLFQARTIAEISGKAIDTVILGVNNKYLKTENKFGTYELRYRPPPADSLYLDMVQTNTFFIDIFKRREFNSKGKPAFWPIRWTKPWQYWGSVKCLNDSTEITGFQLLQLNTR